MAALELVAALALVAANAFFVLTEFAITRIRPTQVDELARRGRRGAGAVRHAVERIDAYLAACQLGITVASLGLGVAGEPAFEALLEPVLGGGARVGGVALAGLLAFLLITVLHVVVGELSPKSLAIARTERSALLVAPPMRIFYAVTKPLVDLFNGMGNLLLRPFGIPPAREAGHAPHTENELRGLIRESEEEGLVDAEEREFTDRVFTFADRPLADVMVSRDHVHHVRADATTREAISRALEGGHIRLPICTPDGDGVLGYVHAIDLLGARDNDGGPAREIARPIAELGDRMPLDQALRMLRERREELAIVTRNSDWLGIVTVADLIEQIVGELEDEFD
jgi:CBS domain containing-hemolysin-like protein